MEFILAFGIAFGFSFAGMLPPGMLNMTTVGLSMKKGFYPALMFGIGAAFIEFGQSLLVIKYSKIAADFLEKYEMYVNYVAVAVLLALAFSFLFAKAKKENSKVDDNLKESDSNTLLKGMTLAFANVLVYPFWLAQGIYWSLPKNGFIDGQAVLDGSWALSITFSIGIFFGSVAVYAIYIMLGEKLLKKFDVIANNMNKILAGLFFLLAALQIIKIFAA